MEPSVKASLLSSYRIIIKYHALDKCTAGVSPSSNTGAIVGGVFGALAFITIIVLLILGIIILLLCL